MTYPGLITYTGARRRRRRGEKEERRIRRRRFNVGRVIVFSHPLARPGSAQLALTAVR
jgi:hypothetical protein